MVQKQLAHVSSLTPRILNRLPRKFRCRRIRNRAYARQRQRAKSSAPFFGSESASRRHGGRTRLLETDWLLQAFAVERPAAVAGYRRFFAEGIGGAGPWRALKNPIDSGPERFVERMQARIYPQRPLRGVPKHQRRALAKPLADHAARYADRAMAEAYRTGAYSMLVIAEHFGVSRMTVSWAVERQEDAGGGVT
jgi:hypothetical protein